VVEFAPPTESNIDIERFYPKTALCAPTCRGDWGTTKESRGDVPDRIRGCDGCAASATGPNSVRNAGRIGRKTGIRRRNVSFPQD